MLRPLCSLEPERVIGLRNPRICNLGASLDACRQLSLTLHPAVVILHHLRAAYDGPLAGCPTLSNPSRRAQKGAPPAMSTTKAYEMFGKLMRMPRARSRVLVVTLQGSIR